jgi:hypothetical protein
MPDADASVYDVISSSLLMQTEDFQNVLHTSDKMLRNTRTDLEFGVARPRIFVT